jgi:hypothetical protein
MPRGKRSSDMLLGTVQTLDCGIPALAGDTQHDWAAGVTYETVAGSRHV